MILAVIPARGGSKRIPQKNIRPFCGQPIIGYSIECAKRANIFDRIIVSTDSAEVADVARQFGAEVPFMRPDHLSDDHTPTIPVVKHAVESIEASSADECSAVCCIYPTAPFLQTSDLQTSLSRLQANADADFCFPVTSFPFPIWRAVKLDDQDRVEMIWPENGNVRSQDLEEAYHDAGQFYWGTRDAWKTQTNIFHAKATAVQIPRDRVQDIDTAEDWVRAEAMFRASQLTPKTSES